MKMVIDDLLYAEQSSAEAKKLISDAVDRGVCLTGKHFPERIYYWQMLRGHYAHCAICGTDYKLLEDEVTR